MEDFFIDHGQQKRVLPFKDVIEMSASARKVDGWRLPTIREAMSASYGA